MNALGVYIHIPFCVRKCAYCGYFSVAGGANPETGGYVSDLLSEAGLRGEGREADSIYLGGGTPSLLPPEQVDRLMSGLRTVFRLRDGAEVTMEANPETVDEGKLRAFRDSGVNRMSFGVQSFKDSFLESLGRIHTAAQAHRALESARRAGFDNVSVDLMFGLPGQGVDDLRADLGTALALPIAHLSCYELAVEEGTPLDRRGVELPDEDTVAAQWEAAMDMAEKAGFTHYEVSNYARPGRECRHNLKYWMDSDFIGLGAGAWSSVSGGRTANPSDLGGYHAAASGGFKPAVVDDADGKIRKAETLVLNLRMMGGCDERGFEARYGPGALDAFSPVLDGHIREGRLERAGGHLRLTRRGLMVANEIWADIYGFFPGGCGKHRANAIFS